MNAHLHIAYIVFLEDTKIFLQFSSQLLRCYFFVFCSFYIYDFPLLYTYHKWYGIRFWIKQTRFLVMGKISVSPFNAFDINLEQDFEDVKLLTTNIYLFDFLFFCSMGFWRMSMSFVLWQKFSNSPLRCMTYVWYRR